MPTDQNPKQLVAQRLKDANNILVTVRHDPSVDELSAALAMALILDKIGKATTAVFSGQIPAAIEFLEPGKTFDHNVDGLRDFIIALDKSKADRLRYKVEDDVVRVFITPYKTTITKKDLTFSQGDFNVDLVVAFGVEKQEDLDTAIAAHGRILHDAAVVTINQGQAGSSLGEVDWSDVAASSVCEMLMSLTESLQSGLLDQPIATAILTGLVSATDRFRNDKTSPKVMTMAAQLMAAGANQQLIAEKLEEATMVTTGKLNDEQPATAPAAESAVDGEMKVDHVSSSTEESLKAAETAVAAEESANAVAEAKAELDEVTAEKVRADLPKVAPEQQSDSRLSTAKISSWRDAAPMTGGVLNATSEQAAEDQRRAEEENKNRVILSHDHAGRFLDPAIASPPILNATTLDAAEPTIQDIFAQPPTPSTITGVLLPPSSPVVAPPVTMTSSGLQFEETAVPQEAPVTQVNPTLADLEREVHKQAEEMGGTSSIDTARAAVDAAFGNGPMTPPQLSTVAAPVVGMPAPAPAELEPLPTPTVPTLPPLPPLPDLTTLPPLPGDVEQAPPPAVPSFGLPEQQGTSPAPPVSTSSDPTQFKLPGQ